MQYYIKYSYNYGNKKELNKKNNLNYTNLSQINYIPFYNIDTYNL